jgi:hypothetical protein
LTDKAEYRRGTNMKLVKIKGFGQTSKIDNTTTTKIVMKKIEKERVKRVLGSATIASVL